MIQPVGDRKTNVGCGCKMNCEKKLVKMSHGRYIKMKRSIYYRFPPDRKHVYSVVLSASQSAEWHINRRRPLWSKLYIFLNFRRYNIFLISNHEGLSELQREKENKEKNEIKLHWANTDFVYYTLMYWRSAKVRVIGWVYVFENSKKHIGKRFIYSRPNI